MNFYKRIKIISKEIKMIQKSHQIMMMKMT